MRHILWTICFGGALLIAVAARAQPFHDLTDPGHFYTTACCDMRHCRKAEPGEVVATERGWFIPETGTTVPYDRARPTPAGADGFHFCISYPDRNEWQGQGEPRPYLRFEEGVPCLWVPEQTG